MPRQNWNRVQATSIRQAMELCVAFARDQLNLSVEQVAELMGEASHFTLYKWIESGRMPAVKVRPFEHACGADFVTRYMAHSANKLIVNMPTGRKATHRELNELGSYTHQVIGMLLDFYAGQADQEQTSLALTQLIEDLAHQRGNIDKHPQPELLLGGES